VRLPPQAVRKSGRGVCAGIYMSDLPSFLYRLIWEEGQLLSVASLTRQDWLGLLRLTLGMCIVASATRYKLAQARQALAHHRAGQFEGAALPVP